MVYIYIGTCLHEREQREQQQQQQNGFYFSCGGRKEGEDFMIPQMDS
jgi:hypothetical protein